MAIEFVTWKQLQRKLGSIIERAHVVLDIGCGIHPQKIVLADVHICVEPFPEYSTYLLNGQHDRNYAVLNCGWREAVKVFASASVDSIFLVDVIEHLEKEDARELLQLTIPLARRQVVIITPYGFMPQHHEDGRDIWGLNGGSWQEHLSGWDETDFDERWNLYVVPDHYKTDNQGRPMEKCYGFLLAVLNVGGPRMKYRGMRMLAANLMNNTYQRMLWTYRWIRAGIQSE